MATQILLSTTGTLSVVTLPDLNGVKFTHPVVDFDLLSNFPVETIVISIDLYNEVLAGTITLKDENSADISANDIDDIQGGQSATPVTLYPDQANTEGVLVQLARADHIHEIPTDVPTTISSANAIGTANSFARSDHVHNHGSLSGTAMHALATTSLHGFMSASDKTKSDYITITQPVDLDDIESRVNALDAAVILKGDWDASSGVFPGGGTAQAGFSYIVSVAGTVDGKSFDVGDRAIAITDNASTTTFATNWFKADYTDQVLSVNALTGAVVLTTADINDSTNRRYVTDAQLVIIGNTSNANSGDNAPNSLYSGIVSNANHTGDATGATALTLATVNSNVGSFGSAANSAQFTVNGKGLITAASSTAIQIAESQVTNLTTDLAGKQATLVSGTNIKTINSTSLLGSGDIAITGNATHTGDATGATALTLATVNSNVGSFGSATQTSQFTVNAKGLITAAASVAIQIAESQVTNLTTDLSSKQSTLVSGTNIKTINTTSLLGSGNITITGNATHTGDATGSTALTVVAINGTLLSGLATGLLKNTTGTGVPSIAVNADLPVMTSTVGGAVPTPPNNTTTFLRGDGTFAAIPSGGTVTSVSVTSANGFAGTVATPTSTPAITITTSVSGLLKGNGTTISAAVSGTDYLAPNASITAGTNIKITYDAKGLVTAGTAATTADINDSTNRRYVTDAQLVVIGNTSNTNSGDNAANSLYSGLVSNATHTGDATGATVLTLATVNSNVGSFGTASNSSQFTVNAKGLITAAANVAIQITESQVTNLTTDLSGKQATLVSGTNIKTINSTSLLGSGDIAITGNATHTGDATGATALTLATVNSNVGSFGVAASVSQFTVNAKGLITAAANVAIQITESQVTNLTTDLSGKQATLVSGTNIKTINSTSLLGSGDIAIVGNATHTGEVTGSTALTITAAAVTNSKLANMATATFKGRVTAGTGVPEDLTVAQAKTLLGLTGTNNGDQNAIGTIAVAGQSDIVVDQPADTLTIAAGTNIVLTTNAATDTLTISAPALTVFGLGFHQVASDAQSTTTSTTLQTKLTLTTSSLTTGTYRVGYSFEPGNLTNAILSTYEVMVNGVVVSNPTFESDNDLHLFSGFVYQSLTGIITCTIKYLTAAGGTAVIQRARFELWRVV